MPRTLDETPKLEKDGGVMVESFGMKDLSKAIKDCLAEFKKNELAYYLLTLASESIIRDKLAHLLHSELNNYVVSREFSGFNSIQVDDKKKKITPDILLLKRESDTLLPSRLIEIKSDDAWFVFGGGNIPVEKALNKIINDLKRTLLLQEDHCFEEVSFLYVISHPYQDIQLDSKFKGIIKALDQKSKGFDGNSPEQIFNSKDYIIKHTKSKIQKAIPDKVIDVDYAFFDKAGNAFGCNVFVHFLIVSMSFNKN